jgi:hypothetical protein
MLERAMGRGMLTHRDFNGRGGHRVAVTLMYHEGHVASPTMSSAFCLCITSTMQATRSIQAASSRLDTELATW